MFNAADDDDDEFRKRSAWLFPLAVVSIVFFLSVAVLLYYLTPGGPNLFREQVAPTSEGDIVALSLNGQKFFIPADYLEYKSVRKGGNVREIAMFAMLPGLQGWSNWQADAFADATADSKVIFLTLRADRNNLSEADRLKRVYIDYVDFKPQPGPYGLTRYDYRPGARYGDEDFYVGQTETGPVVLRCVRKSQDAPSPNCLREQLLTKGVALIWRFKRTQLAKWRQIDAKVTTLIAEFRQAPK
jgi:hypothetical protein